MTTQEIIASFILASVVIMLAVFAKKRKSKSIINHKEWIEKQEAQRKKEEELAKIEPTGKEKRAFRRDVERQQKKFEQNQKVKVDIIKRMVKQKLNKNN